MRKCMDCKHHSYDYIYEEDMEDELEICTCTKSEAYPNHMVDFFGFTCQYEDNDDFDCKYYEEEDI